MEMELIGPPIAPKLKVEVGSNAGPAKPVPSATFSDSMSAGGGTRVRWCRYRHSRRRFSPDLLENVCRQPGCGRTTQRRYGQHKLFAG